MTFLLLFVSRQKVNKLKIMNITLIQTALTWEDAEANRQNLTEKINSINESTDLILLPEMFSTGFTMRPEAVAERMDGPTVAWMKKMAAERDCAVTGSLVVEEDGNYYNRLFFVLPDGSYKTYDKRHLFSLAGEDKAYTKGNERLIVEYRGWKICLLICYDLRFPVFARNTENYDLLLYVANWPEPRIQAWDILLKARAIENVCYVAGVSRTGQDENGHNYPGHSQVVDMLGNTIIDSGSNDGVYTATLNKNELAATRVKFSFLDNRDSFTLAD
jgi:predicted amidohydrolase